MKRLVVGRLADLGVAAVGHRQPLEGLREAIRITLV